MFQSCMPLLNSFHDPSFSVAPSPSSKSPQYSPPFKAMTSRSPSQSSPTAYASIGYGREAAQSSRCDDLFAKQQRASRKSDRPDPWVSARHPVSSSYNPGPPPVERAATTYQQYQNSLAQRWSTNEWLDRRGTGFQDVASPLPNSRSPPAYVIPSVPQMAIYPHDQTRSDFPHRDGIMPAPLLRRTSSENAGLGQLTGSYYIDAATSSTSLPCKTYSQRRMSKGDEFDGPSQLLDKPADIDYEPKEEDLPNIPITLHAQEQDEMLGRVNDRLSQCAFDFVARYQFPIPIEPDKRPVRVPSDREWSEWVYLLKRLATKRRIPARVLYNGQIKQLITILENSLEMRHAAKHQSRPLKDDRNILQLISSGLQVAKIVKDAPAMQYLDDLYTRTERLIQSRLASTSPTSYGVR